MFLQSLETLSTRTADFLSCHSELMLLVLWVPTANHFLGCKSITAFIHKFSHDLSFYQFFLVAHQTVSHVLQIFSTSLGASSILLLLTKHYQQVYNKHIVYNILAPVRFFPPPNCFYIQKSLGFFSSKRRARWKILKTIFFSSSIHSHLYPFSMMSGKDPTAIIV